MNSQKTKLIN